MSQNTPLREFPAVRRKYITLKSCVRKKSLKSIISASKKLDDIQQIQHKASRNLEEEQIKTKISRRKEIIKTRTEINKTENRKLVEKISKTKSCFSETTNTSDKYLARQMRKKKEKAQIIKIRNEEVTQLQIQYILKGKYM